MSLSNMFKGFTDFFSVDNPVLSSSFNMTDDIVKTQNALSDLGHFNTQTPDIGEGLKSFQAEKGLKVDGVMNPGGPTENALSQTLASNGIGNTDLLKKSDNPLPSNVTVKQQATSKPDTKAWTASASFGNSPQQKPVTKPKIDPMTGLEDPLAKAPKGKMPTAKQWEEAAKLQKQKFNTAIVPEGDTVQKRIMSMMQDNRYQDKNDTRLRDHVVKQFEKAYPGEVQYDETGKMIQAKAVIRPEDVEAFDPDGELYHQETPSLNFEQQKQSGDTSNEDQYSFNQDVELELNSAEDRSKQAYLRTDLKDEVDIEEAYRDLGYDPGILNGDLWNGIKSGDVWEKYINKKPGEIKQSADDAFAMTEQMFGKNGRNSESDAFRHAYWSYLMAKRFGSERAKQIGDGHEANPQSFYEQVYGKKGSEIEYPAPDETLMDLYNNRVGRQLYEKYKDSGKSPEEIIMDALKSGQLRTSPLTIRKTK